MASELLGGEVSRLRKKAIYICFGAERGSHDRNACQLKKSRVGFLKDPSIANASDKPKSCLTSIEEKMAISRRGKIYDRFSYLLNYLIFGIFLKEERD